MKTASGALRKLLPGKTPSDGNGSSGKMTGHIDPPPAWEFGSLRGERIRLTGKWPSGLSCSRVGTHSPGKHGMYVNVQGLIDLASG